MVVQYTKILSQSFKMHVENMGYTCILKEEKPSKPSGSCQRQRSHHSELMSGIIYKLKSNMVKCDEYIGESSITFGERFKEHCKAKSAIYDHCNITGHTTTVDNFEFSGDGGPEAW